MLWDGETDSATALVSEIKSTGMFLYSWTIQDDCDNIKKILKV